MDSNRYNKKMHDKYNPDDISNWLVYNPNKLLLSFSSEIRTIISSTGNIMKIIEDGFHNKENMKFQDKTVTYIINRVKNAGTEVYKLCILAGTYTRLCKEGRLQCEGSFDSTYIFHVSPKLDDDLQIKEWVNVSPLTMIEGIFQQWLFHIEIILEMMEKILNDKKEEMTFNITKSFNIYDLAKMVLDDTKVLRRIVETGLLYRKHFSLNGNE